MTNLDLSAFRKLGTCKRSDECWKYCPPANCAPGLWSTRSSQTSYTLRKLLRVVVTRITVCGDSVGSTVPSRPAPVLDACGVDRPSMDPASPAEVYPVPITPIASRWKGAEISALSLQCDAALSISTGPTTTQTTQVTERV